MKDKIRKIISISVIVLIMFSFTYMAATVETYALDANVTDNIIEGKIESITRSDIIVNNIRFDFCSGITVYSRTTKIALEDLGAGAQVELYERNGCAYKIVVSMFPH